MDAFIFEKINQLAFRNIWLDTLMIFFANYFPYIVAFCLLLLLAWNFKKYWLMVFFAFLSGVLARGITEAIRLFWDRPRPFVENHVNLLLHINSASFPSGHAAFFFGISTIAIFFNKKIGILLFIASFLISLGRVYSGIHWPYDILGGLLVGVISGLAIFKISKIFKG